MIELEQITPLQGPRPEGSTRVRRSVPAEAADPEEPGRRSILGGFVTVGATLGLTALGVFAPARQAIAAGYRAPNGYQIKGLPCPSYASWHNCSPGCGGRRGAPSRVCRDATCCNRSGSRFGWHRNGGSYRLRKNQCHRRYYDGWLWAFTGRCGPCRAGRTYRCHDGYKGRVPTICRWTTHCGGCC